MSSDQGNPSVTRWVDASKDLDDIKEELRIPRDDSEDDTYLESVIVATNRKIDNRLYPFKDQIPTDDVKITDDLRDAGIQHVVYKYKKKQNDYDAAKAAKADFEDTIKDVIARCKANPSEQTRTKRVSVGTPYRTRRMFSQRRRY